MANNNFTRPDYRACITIDDVLNMPPDMPAFLLCAKDEIATIGLAGYRLALEAMLNTNPVLAADRQLIDYVESIKDVEAKFDAWRRLNTNLVKLPTLPLPSDEATQILETVAGTETEAAPPQQAPQTDAPEVGDLVQLVTIAGPEVSSDLAVVLRVNDNGTCNLRVFPDSNIPTIWMGDVPPWKEGAIFGFKIA